MLPNLKSKRGYHTKIKIEVVKIASIQYLVTMPSYRGAQNQLMKQYTELQYSSLETQMLNAAVALLNRKLVKLLVLGRG